MLSVLLSYANIYPMKMKLLSRLWLSGILLIAVLFSISAAQSEIQTVTVKKGDTFLGIALEHGISVEQLAAANPSVNPDMILSNQELVIPPADPVAFRQYMDKSYRQYIQINSSACYPETDLSAVCLVEVTSLADAPIANLRFEFALTDNNGIELKRDAAPFLAVLLPGERQLFSFSVPGTFSFPTVATGTITALQLFPAADFSLRVPQSAFESTIVSNGSGKATTIQIRLKDEAIATNYIIVAEAYNSERLPVGVRAAFLENSREIEMTLYALTDQISQIELQMEGY